MGEMQKIVLKVEASELPADIRVKFAPGTEVTLTYEGEASKPPLSEDMIERRKRSLLQFAGVGADRNTTIDEAVARIRELRDEWD